MVGIIWLYYLPSSSASIVPSPTGSGNGKKWDVNEHLYVLAPVLLVLLLLLGVLCWTYRGMKIYNQRKNPSNLVRSSQSASFHIAAQRQGKTRSKKLQTGQKNKEGQVNYTPHSDSKFIFSSTSKVSTLTKKIMSIICISISSTGKHFSALILGWKHS